ncbi:Uncharacterised protein [Acidipropionibacterium jensenii]|uniref:Uncharacterized protein n=1 Tax=Acidipropionibacterium jensenii TaxID=1749 RepID=A0A3S4YY87_9ACTN|nr:Uncharacterised protein [Acidipropionibacterium jensenii]
MATLDLVVLVAACLSVTVGLLVLVVRELLRRAGPGV